MVALIARRSKYDFWIPGEILTLEIKIQKNIFFLDVKIPPGIQKSYLERRAMSASMLKTPIQASVAREKQSKNLPLGGFARFERVKTTNFAWK